MSISNPGWWAIIGASWIFAIGPGQIEGYFNPAVTPLEVSAQEEQRPGWVKFTGTTIRQRPECSYLRIEWFLGTRDGLRVPTHVQVEPPQLRAATGEITLTDWEVFVGNAGALSRTHADVIHECRSLGVDIPWKVRTQFWN